MNEEKEQIKESRRALWMATIFISLAGIGLLALTIYYIVYLPVPAIMQPLKIRIITMLQLEKALERPMVLTREDLEEIIVYKEADEGSEEMGSIPGGKKFEKLEEIENWVKIKIDQELEGWIKLEYIELKE